MLLIPLLVLATAIAGLFYLFGTLPTSVAWICLIIGSLALISRGLAWLTGAAQQGIAIVRQHGSKAVAINLAMELVIWILGITNILLFWSH